MTRPERPRHRGIWIAVAAITACTAIAPAAAQVLGVPLGHSESVPNVSYHAITALEIDAGSGSVTVGTGPPGEVAVERTVRWTLVKPHVEQSWNGGTLTIKAVCEGRPRLFPGLGCDVDLNVRVPATVTVRATLTSGNITAQGLTGAVRLQARSGSVSVAGTSGSVWARVNSGSINGTDLSSPQVDAAASSGTVGLGFAGPPQHVKAATSSGSLEIVLPRGYRYGVDLASRSDNVTIDPALRDDTSSRRIDIATHSGTADVRYSPT